MRDEVADRLLRTARLERLEVRVKLRIRCEAKVNLALCNRPAHPSLAHPIDWTRVRTRPRRRRKHHRILDQKLFQLVDQRRHVRDQERKAATGRLPDLDDAVTDRKAELDRRERKDESVERDVFQYG